MRRWLMVGAALVFPVVGALALAGTAEAATGVACTKLTGTVNSSDSAKVTISGCNDTANTGGSGTTTGNATATTGTITWKGTGTTTLGGLTTTVVTPDKCPGSDLEEMTTGTVTGGTGKAAKSIKKNWTTQSFVCYNPGNNKLALLKGTKYQIGPGL